MKRESLRCFRLFATRATLVSTMSNYFYTPWDKYKSISPGNIKLDLVGLIAVIPSSTSSKISVACPPHSTVPPPCYMGVGMNSYLQDSERMPQWRGDAYLITNGYNFYVENARTNAWLSMIPDSGPGVLCEIDVSPSVERRQSILSTLSYVLPVTAVIPGAILGGATGITVAAAFITAGVTGMLFSFEKEKYDWVGPANDSTFNRLLVLCPEDKWYLLRGQNKDIKSVTAGSAISKNTWKTVALQWIFKFCILTVAISAANAVFMVQVGLVTAYALSTLICEIIVSNNKHSVIICDRKCKYVNNFKFESKQDMLTHVEKYGIPNTEKDNWRKHFGLTN